MDEERLQSRLQDLSPSKCWVVGAAIFQEPESKNRRILLLQRASHDTFPNAWELPGGHVEPDEKINDAVRREVEEETSLIVANIIGELKPMTWESKSKTQSNVQLNYVVKVQPGGTVKPDPKEHSDWRWATLEDLESLYITPEMRKVVQDALNFTVGSA